TLTVKNDGLGALVWRIREAPVADRGETVARGPKRAEGSTLTGWSPGPDAAASMRAVPGPAHVSGLEPAKGELDSRAGMQGSGGPDGFGYTWTDSDEPGGPAFVWNDISGVGTPVTLLDDDFAEVPLPFEFAFYGRPQTDVRISSNGYLTFVSDATAYNHDPIPTTTSPSDLIAPFWVDLNPELGGTIHYHHDENTGRFVVQYTDVYDYWSTGTKTFQVLLDPDGSIRFKYLDMNGVVDVCSIGIEDVLGLSGLQVSFNAPYVHDALTVLIEDAAPWLVEAPAGGAQLGGISREIELTAYPEGLPTGLHEVNLVFESNDPDEPEFVVTLGLLVIGPPEVEVQPEDLAFTVMGGGAACDTLNVSNVGGSDLTWYIGKDPRDPGSHGQPGGRAEGGPERFANSAASSERPVAPSSGDEGRGGERGYGGPDSYGYSWKDSNTLGGPAYSWFDIYEIGSQLMMGDDTEQTIALPLPFPFYGGVENFVTVSSNGYLTFGSNGSVPTNGPIPDAAVPNALVAPFWDDLNPGIAGAVHTFFEPQSMSFIVQYTGVATVAEPWSSKTFQVILRDDGSMLFQYNTMTGTVTTATIGIESPSGAVGLPVAYDEAYVENGLAVEITPGCPWLTAAPWYGVSAPGMSEPVTVCVNAADLELGEHECNLLVRSDDPDSVTVIVPILVYVVDTGVEGDPVRYELFGNFPNPFNPVTEIRYVLPTGATVELEIYSLSGRLVRTLLAGESQDPGRYAVIWDGRERDGNLAASGVYFYRLVADGEALTRKMILLK
ncbi:MAG: FlgD immunoglobulin-like domain containing protein, partial [Candidatus Eisenbacteria bacterium]